MRILLSCLQSLNRHSIAPYSHWRNYFVEGLVEAGHEVVEVANVDWAEGMTYAKGIRLDAWRARTWETAEAFARQETAQRPIDLFVGYLYPEQVEVSAISELQRMGIPCVNFFCDNVREFLKPPAEYAPFDLHWVPEFEALAMYRKSRLPFVHAAMPCWISPELRSLPRLESEPATFIGSPDVLRRDLLGGALQDGADFVIRGNGWLTGVAAKSRQVRTPGTLIRNQIDLVKRHGVGGLLAKVETRVRPLRPREIEEARIGAPLSDTEYFRVTREALVTIGVNRVPTANRSLHRPLVYSRLRDVEAPMLGACYLTEWTEGLEHMYDLGEEIETYRTAEELTGKLSELRKDSARRTAMRQRAQRRALAEHTVGRSIELIRAHFGI
jgi:glycosyl transferase family 1